MMKRVVFIFALVFLAANVFAAGERPVFLRDYRPLGMGSAFTAVADDHNAIFYNPAGLAYIDRFILTVFDFKFTLGDDMLKFYDFYDKNKTGMENFSKDDFNGDGVINQADTDGKSTLMQEILDKITKYRVKFIFQGPLDLNFIKANETLKWGIAVNENIDIGLKINFDIIPNVDIWGNGDVLISAPFAFKPLEKLAVGTTLKVIYREGIAEYGMNLLAFEGFSPTLQPGLGLGADVGAMYKVDEALSVGAVARDFLGTAISFDEVKDGTTTLKEARTGVIYQRVNLGVAYNLSKGILSDNTSLPEIVAAFDLWDVTNAEGDSPIYEATFFSKVHMGVEARFKFGYLSLGINSGYPSMGLGLNLWAFKLNYTYYTDEAGTYAGDIPESKHMINLAVRFGTTPAKQESEE